MNNYFTELSSINVGDQTEKKGPFPYLSWPYAVAHLRRCDPTATWEVRRFDGGLPYLCCDAGYFVEVAVTVQGITLSQLHPVLDNKNRPIPSPTSFDINTSIQRCLVKAIALHGLGLSLYAGEDLQVIEASGNGKPSTLSAEQQANVQAKLTEVDGDLKRLLAYFKVQALEDILATDYERVMRSLSRGRKAA